MTLFLYAIVAMLKTMSRIFKALFVTNHSIQPTSVKKMALVPMSFSTTKIKLIGLPLAGVVTGGATVEKVGAERMQTRFVSLLNGT